MQTSKTIRKGEFCTVLLCGGLAFKRGFISRRELISLSLLKGVKGFPDLLRYRKGEKVNSPDSYFHSSPDWWLGTSIMEDMESLGYEPMANLTYRQTDGFDLIQKTKEMHLKGIAHRDLHPGNLMVNPETKDSCVIGFGNSVQSYRCALIEALSLPRDGFFDGFSYRIDSSTQEKLTENAELVTRILKDMGGTSTCLRPEGGDTNYIPLVRAFYANI